MSKVLITRSKLDGLATTIAAKSGASLPLTIAQMESAVDGIELGIIPSGTKGITDDGTYDVTQYESVDVGVKSSMRIGPASATPSDETQIITPSDGYGLLLDRKTVDIDNYMGASAAREVSSTLSGVALPLGSTTVGFLGEVTITWRYTVNQIVLHGGTTIVEVDGFSYHGDRGWMGVATHTSSSGDASPGNIDLYCRGGNSSTSVQLRGTGEDIGYYSYDVHGWLETYDGLPLDALSQVTVKPIPSEYIVPTGTKSITANGTGIDVSQYASVDVAVPASEIPSNYGLITWDGSVLTVS